jgi:hypothetical protein
MTNAFEILGLPVDADLTDDDVRSAWRRVAAATHPDLAGGGDVARYTDAVTAYDQLRTASRRSEVLACLADGKPRWRLVRTGPGRTLLSRAGLRRIPLSRTRLGRQAYSPRAVVALMVRVVAAATVVVSCVLSTGWQPATLAILTGAVTWLILTAWRLPG